METELSPQLQNQLAQFQQLQQQLQLISSQRVQLEMRRREIEMTLEELKGTDKDTAVYKSIGSLLIEVKDKETLQKQLEEERETVDVRIKALERQEKGLAEKYQKMQDQLTKALSGTG